MTSDRNWKIISTSKKTLHCNFLQNVAHVAQYNTIKLFTWSDMSDETFYTVIFFYNGTRIFDRIRTVQTRLNDYKISHRISRHLVKYQIQQKVSYRKLDRVSEVLIKAVGVVSLRKFSLIFDHHAKFGCCVSYTVWAHVPKLFGGRWGPAPLRWGVADPIEITPFSTCVLPCSCACMVVFVKWYTRVYLGSPYKVTNVIQVHWNRHLSISYLWLPISDLQ